jgi:predicted transcriptional regulator
MKLSTIRELLKANVLTGEDEQALSNIDIKSACGSDLMSDVLAFAKDQGLLLTGLVNNQVIRTAEMMDFKAVCFVRGKTPDEGIIKLATMLGMPVLQTDYSLFTACGRLYDKGLMREED